MKKRDNKQSFSANKTEELELRVADLENQLKRAVADYHNLEKRVSDGRSELTNFVGAELIKKILPVQDNLETALKGGMEEGKSGWFKGVEISVKQLRQVLQEAGLELILIGPADDFNPALHEAVDTREGPEGKILDVIRVGYTLNGKVVRAAQVVVGKENPPSMEETENLPGGETSNLTMSEQSDFHIPPEEDK